MSDAAGGLFDATVSVNGAAINSTTNFDGNYAIATKTGDILIFSYFGYKSQEIKIVDQFLKRVLLASSMSGDLPTINTFNVLRGINYLKLLP